jgi:hypothetical protein
MALNAVSPTIVSNGARRMRCSAKARRTAYPSTENATTL